MTTDGYGQRATHLEGRALTVSEAKRRDKTILKLLAKSQEAGGEVVGIKLMLEPIVKVTSWDQVLLALSNLCVQFSGTKGKRKYWYNRAKFLHKVMEREKSRKLAKEEACRIITETIENANAAG